MPTHHLLRGFSYWGLEGLFPTPDDGLDQLKAMQVNALEINLAHVIPERMQRVAALGLQPVIQVQAEVAAGIAPALEAGKRYKALLVNVHAGSPHLGEAEAVTLANQMIDLADAAGVRLLFETHRGRVTQDLFRTARLCELISRMRFTLDVSHYVLCKERPGPTADLKPLLQPILDRTEMIHGRVSNGQQIQVDIGDGSGELAVLYQSLWSEAMRRWRLRNRPGSAMIFTPELGPPEYAITSGGTEFSDRLEQNRVIAELAQQAWKDSAVTSQARW